MLARTDWERPEAPRPVDAHRAARQPPGRDDRTDRAGQRRSRLLPGVLRRRHGPRRPPARVRERRVGGGADVCCSTNATRPPASGSATATWGTARVAWAATRRTANSFDEWSAPRRAGAPTVTPPSGSSSAEPASTCSPTSSPARASWPGQRAGELDGPWGSLLKLGEGMDTPSLDRDVTGDRRVERRDLERRRARR